MSFFKRKIFSLWNCIWYSRHYFGHLAVGLIYAWLLREIWGYFSWRYVTLTLVGSAWIDVDHLLYSFTYGRHDAYAKEVRQMLYKGQIRSWFVFTSNNHKYLTGLMTHNIFFIGFFLVLSLACAFFDWNTGVILFGATVLHLMFDAAEDIIVLGYLNENWKRMPRRKRIILSLLHKLRVL